VHKLPVFKKKLYLYCPNGLLALRKKEMQTSSHDADVTCIILSSYVLSRVPSAFVSRPITNLEEMNNTPQQDEDAEREWGILLLLCVNITADVYVYITPSSSSISTAGSRSEVFSHNNPDPSRGSVVLQAGRSRVRDSQR
jgi:hypothetical protein